MDKKLLTNLILEGLSQREIALEMNKSQSTIRYWFKKFKIKTSLTKEKNKILNGAKICNFCNIKKSIDSFYRRKNGSIRSYCISCSNKKTIDKVTLIKKNMVEYKGGKCFNHKINFGYELDMNTVPLNVFEFHHINAKLKDINFKTIKYQKWSRIIKELDLCILLCANCHRIEHDKLNKNRK